MPPTTTDAVGEPISETIVYSLATSGKTPEEIFALSPFDIKWHISETGALWMKSWQVLEDFVTPEKAMEIRFLEEPEQEHRELDWLSVNLQLLRDQYPDRWVAISNNEVIEAANTLNELIQILPENVSPFITFIPSEPVVWDFAYGN